MSDTNQFDPELTLVTGAPAGGRTRELKPGDIVGGNYKIKSIIGRGGMGVVYQAEHLVIHRDYALKTLAPDRVNESNWQRFQTEGKAIAKLDHPNIVKVYDMATDGPDCLYYVMDLLQGMSLAEVIQHRGILKTGEALEIFGQICVGLGYAHKLGLVHRDLKPTNIILCGGATGSAKPLVKIIDFGLVKLLGDADQGRQSQTALGQVCGSPHYMSPEQCMGGKIDQRSDIYSLGCTLFECLAGEPPFNGKNALETAFMHQNQAPPKLSDFRPDKGYPENLEQLIGRMLQKIPAQRYQSMEQVAEDLARVKQGKSVNRDAIHKQGALFELNASEAIEAAGGKVLPIAVICLLGAVVTIFAGWAAISSFIAHPQKTSVLAPAVDLSDVLNSSPAPAPAQDYAKIRQEFDKWPQISNGIVSQNGCSIRLFKFPDEPVGLIGWGKQVRLARGEIKIPANEPVTLVLPRPEGLSARRFPNILAKIGPEDISNLQVTEPEFQVKTNEELSDISPQLINSLGKWKALQGLNFYHATLGRDATMALNQLHPVKDLRLRDSTIDGDDLAQVTWLGQLKALDVKNIQKIDPVLYRLRGSKALERLLIDTTSPSREALSGLTQCPNLKSLSIANGILDDDKLGVICDIPNLTALSISHCSITPNSFRLLPKLRKLHDLDVGSLSAADRTNLQAILPRCSIRSPRNGKRDFSQLRSLPQF